MRIRSNPQIVERYRLPYVKAVAIGLVTRLAFGDRARHAPSRNKKAWNTFAWFATLVSLADGLSKTGFVEWFADVMSHHMSGFSPTFEAVIRLLSFFFRHYVFASVTAHTTAMPRVMLTVVLTIPGMPMAVLVLLPAADYWRLGAIFGVVYIVIFLAVSVPLLL